ncbi:hypothetical protein L207DRAFT_522153 [Hyaloscypha variabilis F]|uniref:Uncharacterized protein n=1 Tax=Hyaloscypha variabilis (strain UAMH 11265 / GT02V1 / F) TaxID=1149755 RepID=A0A2J6SDH5_HYAVF|nr:hypothetical protein L207DRAFT_522153 [Hyaloscypha variabilis F]
MASNAGDSLVPARDTRNWQSANAGALSDHCVRRGIFEKPPVGTKLPATTMMKALIMCWEWGMFNEDGTMDDRTARLVEGWFKLSNNGQVEGLLKDNGLVAGEGVNKQRANMIGQLLDRMMERGRIVRPRGAGEGRGLDETMDIDEERGEETEKHVENKILDEIDQMSLSDHDRQEQRFELEVIAPTSSTAKMTLGPRNNNGKAPETIAPTFGSFWQWQGGSMSGTPGWIGTGKAGFASLHEDDQRQVMVALTQVFQTHEAVLLVEDRTENAKQRQEELVTRLERAAQDVAAAKVNVEAALRAQAQAENAKASIAEELHAAKQENTNSGQETVVEYDQLTNKRDEALQTLLDCIRDTLYREK